MNLLPRLALALSLSTVGACGGSAAFSAPASFLDDAAWRPCESTQLELAPKVAAAAPVPHGDVAPVAMKPNPRQNPHGSLNAVHE